MDDTCARPPNNLQKEHYSFGEMVKLCCYDTTKYDSKCDSHVGEQLILNLILSRRRT